MDDRSRTTGDYPAIFRGYAMVGYSVFIVGRRFFGLSTPRWDELSEDKRCDWIETGMRNYQASKGLPALRADDV